MANPVESVFCILLNILTLILVGIQYRQTDEQMQSRNEKVESIERMIRRSYIQWMCQSTKFSNM